MLAFKLPTEAVIVTDDSTISVDDIHENLGVPRERIWMFRNGIDKALFQGDFDKQALRRELGLPEDAKIILWTSQLVNWKHPERLFNALPAVLAQAPETRVLILGDGPMRGYLETLSQQLGISHAVRFDGFVSRDKLPAYFHAADIFTAFYDYGNIGNSTLEAMLCGLPIVALDNGHTADVVHHGETGLLIPPEQPDQISDALLTLLQDDNLRDQMGTNAASYADSILFTWEERIDQEIAMIEAHL